jgi:hypothetical protein
VPIPYLQKKFILPISGMGAYPFGYDNHFIDTRGDLLKANNIIIAEFIASFGNFIDYIF